MDNDQNKNRTEYADDAINVQNGTQPEEIQEFVEQRATNPVHVNGLTVWNFNNHVVNEEQLADQADDLIYDEYLISFQSSGVWGYMVALLPERIRDAEILAYNQTRGKYNPYPNFYRHSEPKENDAIQQRIADQLREEQV